MHSLRSRFAENLRPKQAYTSQKERESRAEKKLQERRISRAAGFGRNRNIGDLKENIDIELTQNKVVKDPQRLKLERWKEERKKQKLANAQKKPFVCGVVSHSVGSPYWSNKSSHTGLKVQKMLICPKPTVPTSNSKTQRPNTRARGTNKQESDQKIGAMVTIPANFKFKAPVGIKPLTIPAQPLKPSNTASSKVQPGAVIPHRVTRSMMAKAAQLTSNLHSLQSAQSKQNSHSKTSVRTESAANLADAVEATTIVMESVTLNQESSVSGAEEKDRKWKGTEPVTPVPKTPKREDECLPVEYSPFVTKERGSARKSKGSTRKVLYSLQQEGPATPMKESTSNTEKEDETQKERCGIMYFRNVLQSEVERLEQTCVKWLALRDSTPELPEEICDSIDVAVGKARLLIKQKLNQFGKLINQCEAGSVPDMPGVTVKCSDLEGFWDMVYMQVEDIDTKFKMLEEAKSRNWQNNDVPSAQIPAKRGRRRSIKKGKKEAAKSSLRAMIAAARKKNQNATSELSPDASEVLTPPRRFSSPIIVNCSSARKSVLQHVLTTEAYKQSASETPTCSMLDLAEIGNNLTTPILLRNDGALDLEKHDVMSNKSNISAITPTPKTRQSYHKSSSKKVRFTEAENNDEKPVQPKTPYANGRGVRRRSSRISSEDRMSMQESSSPLLPDTNMLSPIEKNSVSGAQENNMEFKEPNSVTPVSKTPKDDAGCSLVHYSPLVTKERGSARKSLHSLQQNCHVTPIKERISNTEKEDETQKERSGIMYFRNVLQSEVERLEQTCVKWLALRDSTPELPEEICDSIDVAVGKARLLIKQKLNQFGKLINQCEAGSVPDMPGVTVKCSDLEGFWDMVYMQVEDVDTKFKILEEAKSRNWQKDEVASSQIPAKTKRGRRRSIKKTKKEVAKSSLRAMIAAARKKNQNTTSELSPAASEVITRPRRFSTPVIVNHSSAQKSVLQHVLRAKAYKQSATETPTCSMLDLADIGSNLTTPILLRNDEVSALEEHGVMSNKSNISVLTPTQKSRQSYKKVRFTEAENNDEEKPVQPKTPYTSGKGVRRRSSRISSEERMSMQESSSPLLPDTNMPSPIERPQRVRRRSTRLIDI